MSNVLDLSTATGLRVGNTDALALGVGQTGIWAKPWTETRRNRIVNPGPRLSTGWGANGIGTTNAFGSGHLVATVTASAVPGSSTIPRAQVVGTSGATPVVAGQPFYLRMDVKHSRGLRMEVRVWFMDAAGAYVLYVVSPTTGPTNDWTPIVVTGTVDPRVSLMGYQVIVRSDLAPSVLGDVFEARNITTDPGTYFDGSTAPVGAFSDIKYEWTGTVDGSASRELSRIGT